MAHDSYTVLFRYARLCLWGSFVPGDSLSNEEARGSIIPKTEEPRGSIIPKTEGITGIRCPSIIT
jgi:hypothetical protein